MKFRLVFLLFFASFNQALSQIASFITSKNQDCDILKVTLDASGSVGSPPLTYYWDFGNGNSASGTDKAIVDAIYVQPGNPVVKLRVIDATGNTSVTTMKVLHVLSGPQIDFSVSALSICPGKAVSFLNNTRPGSSPISGYIWEIGNNVTFRTKDASFAFPASGQYDVTLVVTDSNGCNEILKKEKLITVQNNLPVNFNADSTYSCPIPFQAQFHDLSDYSKSGGDQFAYQWDFGDGTTSTSQNPSKIYPSLGTYTVTFTATDVTNGCVSQKVKTNYITTGALPPKTSVSLAARHCESYVYTLDPNSNVLPARFSKSVDLGDGAVQVLGNEDKFTHTYTQSGVYIIKTTYSDPRNSACTLTGYDTLLVPSLGVDIMADQMSNCQVPMKVNFATKNIPDGAFYQWDFGDGTTSQLAAPQKTYTTKGIYSVKVSVWSKEGCIYAIEKNNFILAGELSPYFTSDAKRIQELPREFDTHPLKDSSSLWGGCAPFTVNFVNKTIGSGITYTWDFGDGSQSTSTRPTISHTYTTAGIYSPMLSANDGHGCSGVYACDSCVRVGQPPASTISSAGPDTVCCLYDKTFSANVDLKDVDLLWYDVSLNDGSSSGLTQAYYKDAYGKWVLEDNTGTLTPYSPPGLGLRYMQTNFAPIPGNRPDFYFYAYKNGCPSKIELPHYQDHVLPWGTFSPLSCELAEHLRAGDSLDFNKVGGNWLIGLDANGQPMKLSKAVVLFEFKSSSGCSIPIDSQVFTPSSLGFDITMGAFQKIQQAGLFPTIKLPSCAGIGDELITSTFLYTDDDAQIYYNHGKCLCQEHWPYKIANEALPVYSLSTRKGCPPLKVEFHSTNGSNVKWVFEDGTILSGNDVFHTFSLPGIYRFKNSTSACSTTKWTDSLEVLGSPLVQLKANQTLFCLNDTSTNKTIQLSALSTTNHDTLKLWKWDFGNGTTLVRSDSGKVTDTYTALDIPKDPTKGIYARLTVVDQFGCQSTDSLKILLRKTSPAFSLTQSPGCFDTLRITPLFLKFGPFSPYSGKLTINFQSHGKYVKVSDASLNALTGRAFLLDSSGSYQIEMNIVGDTLGACPSKVDTIILVNYQSLTAGFKILSGTTFSCVPALVETKDMSTLYGTNPITSWAWTFFNTNTKVQVKGTGSSPPPFALTDSGYYNISLAIQDKVGCKKMITKDSAIFITTLKGHIDSVTSPVCVGEKAYFKGVSSDSNEVYWDFGDGFVEPGREVYHAYVSGGERKISFIVTDSANCRKSFTDSIMVNEAPKFSLGQDTIICEGNAVLIKGPIHDHYSYAWNSGATTSSILASKPGVYSLIVRDTTMNCPASDSLLLHISSLPKLHIDSLSPVCLGETVTLRATLDSSAMHPIWRNNGLVIGKNAAVAWVVSNVYPVVLQVENSIHCTNRDSVRVPIIPTPQISLSNPQVCPGDSALLSPVVTNANSLFHYQWYQNSNLLPGDTFSTKRVREKGSYQVEYGKPHCLATAIAHFNFHSLPSTATNPSSVTFCEEYGTIDIDGGLANSYEWIPEGVTKRFLTVDKIGSYVLKIGNEFNCYAYDTVIVENRCGPKLYVPNAFTPEQEGDNQVHTIFAYNIGKFELLIFNRWGEVIYQTSDFRMPWNGYYRNELMPSGSYPWIITYSGNNPDYTTVHQLEGKVVLVR
jgi:gliding motility-associated-like protein